MNAFTLDLKKTNKINKKIYEKNSFHGDEISSWPIHCKKIILVSSICN